MANKRNSVFKRSQNRDAWHLQQQLKELRDLLQERGGQVKESTLEQVHELGESLKHYYDEGRERVDEVEEGVSDFVRTRPLQSILAALGIGFLLSFLFRR